MMISLAALSTDGTTAVKQQAENSTYQQQLRQQYESYQQR